MKNFSKEIYYKKYYEYKDNIPKKDFEKRLKLYKSYGFFPSEYIEDLYKKYYITDEKGEKHYISSGIKPPEGYHLYSLVKDNKFKNVCEVGMAYGMSSLYICQAFKDSYESRAFVGQSLISIDPNQSTQWKNLGKINLERAGLSGYSSVIEEKSFVAFAQLLERKYIFDLIFIDGMHLMDYTISDLMYADKLTKVGSVIVLDDIRHKGVEKAFKFILKNYNHWLYLGDALGKNTTATFLKIKDDERSWNYHAKF